jgi:SRSO17 transposase
MSKKLAGCDLTVEQLMPSLGHMEEFLKPFGASLVRIEQKRNLDVCVRGRLSMLERRTLEPIATAHGLARRPVQRFVGDGPWDERPILGELKRQVVEHLGHEDAVLSVDPSGFAKKGEDSVGVTRQWCGRLGKVENSQKGVFLSYASPRGFALVDFALYLPRAWADDAGRRTRCDVPEAVEFLTCQQIAERLVLQAAGMPHSWVTADDEFGRDGEFRRALRFHGERYVLDVPSNTRVVPRPSHAGRTPATVQPVTAKAWADAQDKRTWAQIVIRDGQKGPIRVRAAVVPVLTRGIDGDFTEREHLVVIQAMGGRRERRYCLTNASSSVPIETLARVAASRHHIEEAFATAKGDVGLAQYEVRSWIGWHHHMALCLVAAWFVTLERIRLGGKNAGHHGIADPSGDRAHASASTAVARRDRASRLGSAGPKREVALRSLAPSSVRSADGGQEPGAAA